MISSFQVTKSLVKKILESPLKFSWSAQGLGMLRLYLDEAQRYRLHIWDSSLRIPNVSPLHDHPWDLTSLIVAGQMRQHRYLITHEGGMPFWDLNSGSAYPMEKLNMVSIKCGEGACVKSVPIKVDAYQTPVEFYFPSQSYSQRKNEVHESLAVDGTVTIVDRTFIGDRETAHVFWRGNGGWVDAAPRKATEQEIRRVTARALEGF